MGRTTRSARPRMSRGIVPPSPARRPRPSEVESVPAETSPADMGRAETSRGRGQTAPILARAPTKRPAHVELGGARRASGDPAIEAFRQRNDQTRGEFDASEWGPSLAMPRDPACEMRERSAVDDPCYEGRRRVGRWLVFVKQVRKWVISQARRVSVEEEWFDWAGFLLTEYERALIAGLPGGSPPELPLRRSYTKAKTKDEEILSREAERGVEALVLTWRGDGSADIRIEGGESMNLKPSLAELLEVISAADPSTHKKEDGLVGWKSYDDVASCLSRKKGASCVGRRALTQRIWKLREALSEAGINPFFVMTSRSKGVRFALRRRVRSDDGR